MPAAVVASVVVALAYVTPYCVNALDCPVPPAVFGKVPVAKALVDVAYRAPPEVNDVRFVPPFVVAKVPATLTAPEVAVEGVRPVDPKVMVVTPDVAAAAQEGFAPAPPDVRTWPFVPGVSGTHADASRYRSDPCVLADNPLSISELRPCHEGAVPPAFTALIWYAVPIASLVNEVPVE